MVYVDGSEDSLSAVMYAILLAKQDASKLDAMYVVNTRALSELVKSGIFIDSERSAYQRDLHKDAERYLKHATKLAKMKNVAISCITEEGSAHRIVRDYIKENGIDLLVLGGMSTIRSRLDDLNSETDRMVRTVTCPVMLVRDEEDVWNSFDE
jgi:nucleotide-binding universal stress UspA family protein